MRRELLIFLAVGILAVLIDYAVYRLLLLAGIIGINLSKGMGFIAGMIFGYFANRAWTFSYKEKDIGNILRFILVYALSLGLNIGINGIVLHLSEGWRIGNVPIAIQLAFLIATGVSASFNFTGMKWFIFRKTSINRRNTFEILRKNAWANRQTRLYGEARAINFPSWNTSNVFSLAAAS